MPTFFSPDDVVSVSPAEPVKRRAPGLFDADDLKILTKTETVIANAALPEFAAPLLSSEIAAPFVSAIGVQATQARQKIALAIAENDLKTEQTTGEARERATFLALLQNAQSAAQQKSLKTGVATPTAYAIGRKVTDMGALELTQTTTNVLERITDDALPGWNALKITQLETNFNAWKAAHDAQQLHAKNSEDARAQAVALIRSSERDRWQIQLAADGLWPHTDKTLKTTREKFEIPVNGPFRLPKKAMTGGTS